MNQFVNSKTRDIKLPAGCKDLIDVLEKRRRKQAPAAGRMKHIEAYLSRVLESKAIFRGLIISSSDYQMYLLVGHHSKGVFPGTTLTLEVDCGTEREETVRLLFGESGILPIQDAVMSNAEVTSRLFVCPLPATAPIASKLVTELLRRVYGLRSNAKLNFHYAENDAA